MSTSEAQTLERRRSQYRDYPEDLKAAVIQAIENNGGNVLATAKLFNLPRDTVNYWWNNSDRFVEIKQTSSLNLADKFESVANSYVDSLAAHDQSIVTARDKAQIAQIAVQNMQLLRGQATSITEVVNPSEQAEALADLLNSWRSRSTTTDTTACVSDAPSATETEG